MNFTIVHKGGWVVYSTQDLVFQDIQEINTQLLEYLQENDAGVTVRKEHVLLGKDVCADKREKLIDSFLSDPNGFTPSMILTETKSPKYKKKKEKKNVKKNEFDYSEEDLATTKFKIQENLKMSEIQTTSDQGISKNNILGMFSILNKKEITQKDLDPVLEKFKNHLISKNVASQISADIVYKVGKEILGESKSLIFQRDSIEKKLTNSLQEILSRILTPKNDLDLIADIEKVVKRTKAPFTITFVGVNGVGKSTNLSKVCFWLLQNRFRVLIAACDTFRSGAVEQLGVHVKNLKDLDLSENKVELYNRGYGKDPASIAKEAIQYGIFNKSN